jgi:hypothetical protein
MLIHTYAHAFTYVHIHIQRDNNFLKKSFDDYVVSDDDEEGPHHEEVIPPNTPRHPNRKALYPEPSAKHKKELALGLVRHGNREVRLSERCKVRAQQLEEKMEALTNLVNGPDADAANPMADLTLFSPQIGWSGMEAPNEEGEEADGELTDGVAQTTTALVHRISAAPRSRPTSTWAHMIPPRSAIDAGGAPTPARYRPQAKQRSMSVSASLPSLKSRLGSSFPNKSARTPKVKSSRQPLYNSLPTLETDERRKGEPADGKATLLTLRHSSSAHTLS